jgi:hypothetical protein
MAMKPRSPGGKTLGPRSTVTQPRRGASASQSVTGPTTAKGKTAVRRKKASKKRAKGPAHIVISDGRPVMIAVAKLITQLHNTPFTDGPKTNLDELRRLVRLKRARFKAMRYHYNEDSPQFTLDEIRQVVQRSVELSATPKLTKQQSKDIIDCALEVTKALLHSSDIRAGAFRELSFFEYLSLHDTDQHDLSEIHSGVYLILRLAIDDECLFVSRLDIHPREPGNHLCRFSSYSMPDSGEGERQTQIAEGYIYQSGGVIYAIGPTIDDVIRYSVLRHERGVSSDRKRDLEGLRLYHSPDDGILAHRLIARYIGHDYDDNSLDEVLHRIDTAALREKVEHAIGSKLDPLIERLKAPGADRPGNMLMPKRAH